LIERALNCISRPQSVFIIDSGATHHFTFQKNLLRNFRIWKIDVNTADSSCPSQGIGDIHLNFEDYDLILKNVIYSPFLLVKVISTERLKKDNYVKYSNWPNRLFDGGTEKTIMRTDISSRISTVPINLRVS
jgi:hypothetical protein